MLVRWHSPNEVLSKLDHKFLIADLYPSDTQNHFLVTQTDA